MLVFGQDHKLGCGEKVQDVGLVGQQFDQDLVVADIHVLDDFAQFAGHEKIRAHEYFQGNLDVFGGQRLAVGEAEIVLDGQDQGLACRIVAVILEYVAEYFAIFFQIEKILVEQGIKDQVGIIGGVQIE